VLRAVLDTNVFVSAFIRPAGPPGRILALLLDGAFVLVLSPPLVAELRRALGYRTVRKYVRLTAGDLELRLAELETLADPVPGTRPVTAPLRDPKDRIVLAAAVEGRADYVVTGDDDLRSLGEHEGIGIVSPSAFLELVGPTSSR
jgi:hypothetical protein